MAQVIPFATQWAVQLPIGKIITPSRPEAEVLARRIAEQCQQDADQSQQP